MSVTMAPASASFCATKRAAMSEVHAIYRPGERYVKQLKEDAHVYAEGVRRGGAMLSARVDEAEAARFEAVLASGGHVDVAARRAEYQAEGWNRFDPAAPAYTASDVRAERSRRRVRVS